MKGYQGIPRISYDFRKSTILSSEGNHTISRQHKRRKLGTPETDRQRYQLRCSSVRTENPLSIKIFIEKFTIDVSYHSYIKRRLEFTSIFYERINTVLTVRISDAL